MYKFTGVIGFYKLVFPVAVLKPNRMTSMDNISMCSDIHDGELFSGLVIFFCTRVRFIIR